MSASPDPGLVRARRPGLDGGASGGNALVVGIVNNMPDGALASTERQFCRLLAEAAVDVRVRFFAIPSVPRGDAGRRHIEANYSSVEDLAAGKLDGLIVTGMEPRAHRLEDEPYWDALAGLIGWANDNTVSTVWSCLAAHAAVQHLDGIRRRRFESKLCGLFESRRQMEHPLAAGMPARWRVPHSRHNDIPADQLAGAGYRVLWRSRDGGADVFLKQCRSLFVFVQNHPEYDHGALGREYRRDVERFLAGASETYPPMPRGYFDPATRAALRGFQARAVRARQRELLAEFPAIGRDELAGSEWRGPAERTFANWLAFIGGRRRPAEHVGVAAGVQPKPCEPVSIEAVRPELVVGLERISS